MNDTIERIKKAVTVGMSVEAALREAMAWERNRWIYCPKHGHSMKPVVLGQDDHFACIHLGCGFELKAKECDR